MKDQIKHIIQNGLSENASELSRQEMLFLFHQPEKEFELKEILFENLNVETTSQTILPWQRKLFDKLWAKIELNQKRQKSGTWKLSPFVKIAAAIIVGLLIGIYVSSLKPASEPVYYSAHSPKGSVSEMILPDGSVIFLNADSRIKYSTEGDEGVREVFLTGEAWFHVAKNKKKPFIVHTPCYHVNVTGTKFNVKAYVTDDEVTTTLEEGRVTIQSACDYKLAEDIVLKPGEQVMLNKKSRELTIKNVNPKWFTSWKDNKLIFVNMSLKELVVLLERKYGVDIEVQNKEILDLHFDGTIKNESIIEILEIIKKALPVNYQITGQKIEISKNKELNANRRK